MQININGKKYELNFGIRFVMLMNQKHNANSNGMTLGMGINQATVVLAQNDVVGLAEILECATWINKDRPTINQIYAFIDNPKTNIDKLFEQVKHELTTSNATRTQVKNMMKTMKAAQARAMKRAQAEGTKQSTMKLGSTLSLI